MGGTAGAKRKAKESKLHSRPNKKFKKQAYYSSGSESEADVEPNAPAALKEEVTGSNSIKVSKKRDQRAIPPASSPNDDEDEDEDEDVAPPEDDSPASDAIEVDDETNDEGDTEPNSEASSELDDSEMDSASDLSPSSSESRPGRKPTKRRDPNAFASSMSAILSSKLTTSNRADPVLARSKTAATASHELAEAKLEAKAKRKLRDEKRALNEKGRVRNVLLGDRRRTPGVSESEAEEGAASEGGGEMGRGKGVSAAEIAEQERRLKKTAQRGVVKLFNAVRMAQVKAEEAAREVKAKGIVGVQRREEKVGEMGRQAFLDLVGKGKVEAV